jgi:hypothetical protein
MSRVKIGKHFFPGTGNNNVLQIIAPAANIHGVILRTISLGSGTTGLAQVALYADVTAPVAPGDGNCRQIAVVNVPNFTSFIVPYEIEVPAGLGVWVGFPNSTGQIQMTYDFVDI